LNCITRAVDELEKPFSRSAPSLNGTVDEANIEAGVEEPKSILGRSGRNSNGAGDKFEALDVTSAAYNSVGLIKPKTNKEATDKTMGETRV